jgi:hypothetical protein
MDGNPVSSLRVFINYRREDSAGHAGRLYDALAERFGRDQIFMDIDTMQPGVDFTKVVDESVGVCDVLIAVIGRRWAGVTDARGVRRLDKPEDWVRIELGRALERGEVQVVPTLVQGADMPSTDELPEPLRPLAFRNAIELSDSRWRYDVGRLIQALERLEEEKKAREAGEQAPRAEAERNAAEPAPATDEAVPERPPIGRSHRGGETEPAPVGATGAPPGHRRRVRWLAVAAAGLIVAAAVAVTVVVAGSSEDPSPGRSSQQKGGGAAGGSAQTLQDRGCDAAESTRSRSSTESTAINFENKTADVVRIYWLNFRGERVQFASLGPGKTLRQETYTTHPWLVTDAAGDCLGLYLPAAEPGRAVISGTRAS